MRGWSPSPGLLALSAYLRSRGIDAGIVDATVLPRPWRDLERILHREQPDVLGIANIGTLFTYDAINAARLAKTVSPRTTVVAGGPHFTFLPEESLRLAGAFDYIVRGEGEETLAELIGALAAGRCDLSDILGISYLDGDRYVETPDRPLLSDLDALPIPAWDRIEHRRKLYGLPSLGRKSLVLNFARGCSGACTFCIEKEIWRNSIRYRSAELMVEEIKQVITLSGKNTFFVGDNSFNLGEVGRQRAIDFARLLIERKVRARLWLQMRLEDLLRDLDLLPLLKEAGCCQIMIGIESVTPSIQERYQKRIKIEDARRACRAVRAQGILTMGCFVMGAWEDTTETYAAVLEFAKENLDYVAPSVLTPLPGTEYFDIAQREELFETTDYRRFDFISGTVRTQTMSAEEVAWRSFCTTVEFFKRPSVILGAFFSRNPLIRANTMYWLKLAIRSALQFRFGFGAWKQPGYMNFGAYLDQRGHSDIRSVERDLGLPDAFLETYMRFNPERPPEAVPVVTREGE